MPSKSRASPEPKLESFLNVKNVIGVPSSVYTAVKSVPSENILFSLASNVFTSSPS